MDGPAATFDLVADTYDRVGVAWFQPIADALLAELDPQPGERALDVGCGRGAVLVPLAHAVGPTGSVLGVDLAPRMVAATAADVSGLGHVEVRVADASALGLPPSSYDVVASSLVLFFLTDPGAAVRDWTGLLVPGGRLGVTTFADQDERWRGIDELFTPWLPQGMLDARRSGRTGPFATDAGVEDLLTGAGLTDVRTVVLPLQATFDDAEQWHRWSWSHGQRAMWEHVPDDERDGVRAAAEQALAQCLGPDGRIALGQDVRITVGRRP